MQSSPTLSQKPRKSGPPEDVRVDRLSESLLRGRHPPLVA